MRNFKLVFRFLIIVIIISPEIFSGTRISEYGSNPFFSYGLFPQDIQQHDGNFIYYYPDYMKTPWWGDIDEPNARPNATYTTTGGSEDNGVINYKHNANIHKISNRLGYTHHTGTGLASSFQMDYTLNAMMNNAEGKITDSGTTYVPFNYDMDHAINSFNLQGILGMEAAGMPMGLRMKIGFENTLVLNNEIQFTKDGQKYYSERALWGWTNSPCAHIFGGASPEADAWLQREYSRGPMYTAEIQGGVTLPKSKLGMLTRFRAGHQDQYIWQYDPASANEVDSNFLGGYERSNWARKTNNIMLSAYGNFNIRSSERYSLNNFFMVGYLRNSSGRALAADLSTEDDAKEKQNILFFEYSPNIRLFSKGIFHYVDAAIVSDYGYARSGNTYEMGVAGGGQKETYWNTGRDGNISLEGDFSYANKNFVDVGADLSTMFPVFNDPQNQLGLGLELLLNTRFTFETRYYGNNDGGEFARTGRLEQYMREVWFNSALVLQYMRMPYHLRLEVTEPLLYSVMPHTKIYHYNSGPEIDSENRKNPTWVGQQGMRVAVFLSRQWTMPFLK